MVTQIVVISLVSLQKSHVIPVLVRNQVSALIDMERHSLKVDSVIPQFRALSILDTDEFIPLFLIVNMW